MANSLFYAALAAIFLLDWRFGARPERIGVVVMLASSALDLGYHALLGAALYASVDLGHLAINTACTVAFLALALRANRIWPLWCSALQIIMTLGHIGETVYPQGAPLAYWSMTFLPTVGQVLAITLGAIAHHQRFARIGHYRDWLLG